MSAKSQLTDARNPGPRRSKSETATTRQEYYKRAHVRLLFNRLDRWIIRRIWSHRYKHWRNDGWKRSGFINATPSSQNWLVNFTKADLGFRPIIRRPTLRA